MMCFSNIESVGGFRGIIEVLCTIRGNIVGIMFEGYVLGIRGNQLRFVGIGKD